MQHKYILLGPLFDTCPHVVDYVPLCKLYLVYICVKTLHCRDYKRAFIGKWVWQSHITHDYD